MSSCVQLPFTPPTLPTGFAFTVPPLPGPPDLSLCCQINPLDYFPFPIQPPFWPPGVVISSATLAAINTAMMAIAQGIQDYIDGLVPNCPKA